MVAEALSSELCRCCSRQRRNTSSTLRQMRTARACEYDSNRGSVMNGNGNGSGIVPMRAGERISISSGINTGDPWRSTFPGGTFAYGCPPIDTPASPPGPPMNPFDIPPVPVPTVSPFDLRALKPEMWAFAVCTKCQRHVRTGEPCPWCLRADLDALKIALGDKAK